MSYAFPIPQERSARDVSVRIYWGVMPCTPEPNRRNLWRFEKRVGGMLRFRLWQQLGDGNVWVPTTSTFTVSERRWRG